MKKLEIEILFSKEQNQVCKCLEKVFLLIENENSYTFYNIAMDFSELANRKIIEKCLKDFEVLRQKSVMKKPIVINGHVRINNNCLSASLIKKLPKDFILLEINDGRNVENTIFKYRKRLSRKNCSVSIRTCERDWQNILKRYRVASKRGIDLTVPYYDSYSDLKNSDFLEWVYDTKGSQLSIFHNICKKYLEGISGWDDCCHNSCLGKYILIGCDGEIYCCKNKYDEMKYSNINEISSFIDIFKNDRFLSIITNSIDRRNECKENCDLFEQCKGGCPLKNSNGCCNEKAYRDYYFSVTETLKHVIEMQDYTKLNPCLRKLIFSSMVSGKLLAEKRATDAN